MASMAVAKKEREREDTAAYICRTARTLMAVIDSY